MTTAINYWMAFGAGTIFGAVLILGAFVVFIRRDLSNSRGRREGGAR